MFPEILKKTNGADSSYSIREGKVYFTINIVPDADVATFKALMGNYGKDKNYIYYCHRKVEEFEPLINYEKFKTINDFYAGDDKIVLCGDRTISTNTKIDDVQIFKQGEFSDEDLKYYDLEASKENRINSENLYWVEAPFPELKRFIKEEIYTRTRAMAILNNSSLYLGHRLLEDIDGPSARIIYGVARQFIIKDKNAVWVYDNWNEKNIKITNDVNHFRILDHRYYYDSQALYKHVSKSKVLVIIKKDFDIRFVKIIHDIVIYKDRVFDKKGKRIKEADGKTFYVLNEYFATDKNHVFNLELSLETCRIVESADPYTFELTAERYYTKDKNHVFYRGFLVPKIDVHSFTITGPGFGCDKNKEYTDEEMEKWYWKKVKTLKK